MDSKSLSAITMPLTEDLKHFQLAKNVLNHVNHDPFASQWPIFLLPLLSQRTVFRFLERRSAIPMKFCQTLVTSVSQDANMLCNVESVVFEKLKVMHAVLAKSGHHNFSGFLAGDQLCFLSSSLFCRYSVDPGFLGCSTGFSDSRNFFERTRTSSTLRMMRQTVDSLTARIERDEI